MRIKNKNVEDRIQRAAQIDGIKCTVLGDSHRGMLEGLFGKDAVDKRHHVVNLVNTISTHVELELLQNKNNEKIRISSTSEALIRAGEYDLYRDFIMKHDITRNLIKTRVTIIMGLAISSLAVHSEFSLYIGDEYKKNIVYSRLNSTIIKDIPSKVFSSSDDLNQRIGAVFNYLWFHDVNDYTGYDREIVRFSLRNWDKIR